MRSSYIPTDKNLGKVEQGKIYEQYVHEGLWKVEGQTIGMFHHHSVSLL